MGGSGGWATGVDAAGGCGGRTVGANGAGGESGARAEATTDSKLGGAIVGGGGGSPKISREIRCISWSSADEALPLTRLWNTSLRVSIFGRVRGL